MNKRLWIVVGVLVAAFIGAMVYQTSNQDKSSTSDYYSKLDPNTLLTKDVIVKAMEEASGKKLTDGEKDAIIDDHYQGPKDSKVVVIEYEDFACPHCQQFAKYAEKIHEDYKDRVLFIARDFNLKYPNSIASLSAGEAAKILGGNDAYWKMNHQLFGTDIWASQAVPSDQREKNFREYAKNAGVDPDKLIALLNDTKNNGIEDKINRDLAIGKAAGVSGTPTWFVNGKKVDNVNDSEIRKVINEALKSAGIDKK